MTQPISLAEHPEDHVRFLLGQKYPLSMDVSVLKGSDCDFVRTVEIEWERSWNDSSQAVVGDGV